MSTKRIEPAIASSKTPGAPQKPFLLRGMRGSALQGIISWAPGLIGWRQNQPSLRAARGDSRALFQLMTDEFSEIEERHSQNEFEDFSDYCLASYVHLRSVLDKVSLHVSSLIGASAAVSLKFLWGDLDGRPAVVNFLRDRSSEASRTHYRPPDSFNPSENTAFSYILSGSGGGYFCAENLLSLEAEGKYKNSNKYWKVLYNSTAVSAVYDKSVKEFGDIIGFLCVDTREGSLTLRKIQGDIAEFSSHVYNVLGALVRGSTQRAGSPIELGWSIVNGAIVLKNPESHQDFKDLARLMEAAYHQKFPSSVRERFYPSLHAGGIGSHYPRGVQNMVENIDEEELVWGATEDDLDPALRTAISTPPSDKEFMDILEKIAPHDTYAGEMLERARQLKIGQ